MRSHAIVMTVMVLLVCCVPVCLSVWPQPLKYVSTPAAFGRTLLAATDLHVEVAAGSPNPAFVQAAVERYRKLMFPLQHGQGSPFTLTIRYYHEDALAYGMDERYNVSIHESSATIEAHSQFGALRGLETFSQCIHYDDGLQLYYLSELPISIEDSPRFAWRGLMLDTSRHYYPVSAILRTVEAMSYNKLNVLHWHLIDAVSFPVESKAYPLLSTLRWGPRAVYSSGDITQVVAYAAARGIRVVPEFDTPGHAYSWGQGYNNLTAKCPKYEANINNIPLNPTADYTYQVVQAFLDEMTEVFPDAYMHLGGDELVLGCWEEDASIVSWMKAHNLDAVSTETYYSARLYKHVHEQAARPRKPIFWEDPLDNGAELPSGSVVEVWKDAATLASVVDKGYEAILAAGYYLDQQIPNPAHTWYEWVDTWKNFYANDPHAGVAPDKQHLVLGGEVAMWSEQVDQANVDSRVWPRACGASERFWSAQSLTDPLAALPRLVAFRCLMAQRGIGAGPVAPDFCPR